MEEIAFAEFVRRLAEFDVIASLVEGGVMLTAFRMGLGTGQKFYPIVVRGEDTIIYPPTIKHLLEYLEINEWEWGGA